MSWIPYISKGNYNGGKILGRITSTAAMSWVHLQRGRERSQLITHLFSVILTLLSLNLFIALQSFLQDLGRGQAAVAAFNELSNHLLREYSTDDTRRIKEVTEKHNAAWNTINNRCTHTHSLTPVCPCLLLLFVYLCVGTWTQHWLTSVYKLCRDLCVFLHIWLIIDWQGEWPLRSAGQWNEGSSDVSQGAGVLPEMAPGGGDDGQRSGRCVPERRPVKGLRPREGAEEATGGRWCC